MTIPAKSVMTTDIVTVSPETTIVETARRMLIHHVSAAPVVPRRCGSGRGRKRGQFA
jgi:CBS domain-containing protein